MSTAEGAYSRTGAEFDPTGAYRYSLWREWDARAPAVAFVMLNPSTADAARDDPTIRRCASFARSWGYGSLEVVNLFAYRASEPKRLRQTPDPIGPANDDYLVDAADRVQTVVVGRTRCANGKRSGGVPTIGRPEPTPLPGFHPSRPASPPAVYQTRDGAGAFSVVTIRCTGRQIH